MKTSKHEAFLLPPSPDKCQKCAVKHDPEQPHNQQSLFYQYWFYGQNGRWPTWEDALAHCTPEVREVWVKELAKSGVTVKPTKRTKSEKPLFIPLKRKYFEAFLRGEKNVEYRPHGPRWNERTIRVGRKVVLSLGYGKQRRMTDEVTSLQIVDGKQALAIPGWKECYGNKEVAVACIYIQVDRRTPKEVITQ